jgi:hypothetical protein
MQEARYETTDRQAVGYDHYPLCAFPFSLPHQTFQETGCTIVTIGRAFPSLVPVVEPTMRSA